MTFLNFRRLSSKREERETSKKNLLILLLVQKLKVLISIFEHECGTLCAIKMTSNKCKLKSTKPKGKKRTTTLNIPISKQQMHYTSFIRTNRLIKLFLMILQKMLEELILATKTLVGIMMLSGKRRALTKPMFFST